MAAGAAAIVLLAGCAATPPSAEPGASVSPVAPATPDLLPAPGATVAASDVPSTARALDVAVVAPGTDAGSAAVTAELDAYTTAHGGTVTRFADASIEDSVTRAMAADPDVVVGVGPDVAGAFDAASASNLDTDFLLIGTQLAEPTANVVAVIWPGADERAVFAEVDRGFAHAVEHAADAVALGVSAAPAGLSGYVIALP
jgi:hypothetical protein